MTVEKPDRIWLIYDHRGGNLNGYKIVTSQRNLDTQPFAPFIEVIGEYEPVPALDEIGIYEEDEEHTKPSDAVRRALLCYQCIDFGFDPSCHCQDP